MLNRLGNVCHYDRPAQLQLNYSNTGRAAGEVEVSAGGDGYNGVDSLLSDGLKPGLNSWTLPVTEYSYSTTFKLSGAVTQEGSARTESMATENDTVVLALSPRRGHFDYLGGYKMTGKPGDVRVNHPPDLGNLPDRWWSYLGQDVVILHDLPALKLEAAAEAALLDWTRAGGNLVLASNGDPAEYRGSLWEPLLPCRIGGLLPGLSGLRVTLRPDARRLGAPGGAPQAARVACGAGSITLVTLPVTGPEALGKAAAKFWGELLADTAGARWLREAQNNSHRLSMLPELPPPASTALAFYLAAYVLVAVPGVYAFLRRRDQVLRLIVAVPALAVAFAGGAYLFNSWGRGRETVLRQLGVAWGVSGDPQVVADHTDVLFSPRAQSFSLPYPDRALMRPDSQMSGRNAPPHRLECRGREWNFSRESVPQWGVSRWRSLSLHTLPGAVSVRSVRTSHNHWTLHLENRTGWTLHGVRWGPSLADLSPPFEVPPGTLKLAMDHDPLWANFDQLAGDTPELKGENSSEVRSALEPLVGGHPVLLAWVSDELFASFRPRGLEARSVRHTLLAIRESRSNP